MFDTKKAISKFKILDLQKKQKKMFEVLKIMAPKGKFWAELEKKFEEKSFSDETVLDYLYELVMRLVDHNQEKKLKKNHELEEIKKSKIKQINEKESKEKKCVNIEHLLS